MAMAFLLAHITTGHIFPLAPKGVGWQVEGAFSFLALSVVAVLQGTVTCGLNVGGRWG
jgi:hypothetical protein